MNDVDRIVLATHWALRSEELPRGTQEQVEAWLRADPRPGLIVQVVKTPEHPPVGEVYFRVATGETLRQTEAQFRERYQPVVGQPMRPEQVPPERPPQTYEEWIEYHLAGWSPTALLGRGL